MDVQSTACFTGHRPYNLGINPQNDKKTFSKLLSRIEAEITDLALYGGITDFISGMALGVDTYAAICVLKMRDEFGLGIRLVCALPCRDQYLRWSRSEQNEYRAILDKADEVICLEERYTDGCMIRRNEFMVNNSSVVIAVWNGLPGGTSSTVRYAKRKEKEIILIDPSKLKEEKE